MHGKTMRIAFLVGLVLVTGLSQTVSAQSEAPATAAADTLPVLAAGPMALPAVVEADTVRTNLWLVEALMAEIVASTAHLLPAAPAGVQVVALNSLPEDDLYQTALFRVLGGLGYDLYLGDEDPDPAGPGEIVYAFRVVDVELEYPDVGRTLGIWRRWVERDLNVAVHVDISEADSGRLLLSSRVERRFGDRVPSHDFDDVNSKAYLFTNAETQESGWKRRLEEIVVLGTLAGLVAIYFANTGN